MTKKIIFYLLSVLIIFAPVAKGAVKLWSKSIVEMAILVAVFLWLWKVVNVRHVAKNSLAAKFKRTPIDLPIWFFVVLAAISSLLSIYKYASVQEMLILMAMVGVFYLVVNNFTDRMVLNFAGLIVVIGAALSLLGIGQYFCGLNHAWWTPKQFLAATYVNHNHFAGYLEVAIPLAIGVFISIKKGKAFVRHQRVIMSILLGSALALMGTAFILAQSRGAWISLIVSLIIMNIVLIQKKVLSKKSIIVVILVIALAAIFLYGGYDIVAQRLRSIGEFTGGAAVEYRPKIYQGTFEMIKKNPLIGTGIGTFVWGFPAYRPDGMLTRTYFAHNDYLHMMAEMGIMAFPLMVWMIYSVISAGLKIRHQISETELSMEQAILIGSAIGILSLSLHGLVDFNFHITANMLLVASCAGLIMRNQNIKV
ncbi:O-antigen ligase family protein [Candidatus Omnitrophota bacterium]